MQGHFLRGTNIDPPSITRKDSESSENTSPDEGNNSESEEDIILNGNTSFLQIQVHQKMGILLNSYLL